MNLFHLFFAVVGDLDAWWMLFVDRLFTPKYDLPNFRQWQINSQHMQCIVLTLLENNLEST